MLAGSTNYRKLFSWRSFSRMAKTLMSKTTRNFFWYILGREIRAGSRRKIPENARNLEAKTQWKILWLDFSSARSCQEFGKISSRVRSMDSGFKVPRNFRWVLTENSLFPTDPLPGMDTPYGHDPWTKYLICFKEKTKAQHLSLLRS